MTDFKPQDGPQQQFLTTSADIALYGGAAGGGKTWALLFEAFRHSENGKFGAVIFRRTLPQIKNKGGLWDESANLYSDIGAKPRETYLKWLFPSGATVQFASMQYDSDRFNWDGAQIPFIGFDELIHFSKEQFFYMLTRNRSMCGVKPYIRATTNPKSGTWVSEFIDWWIDDETGYPIKERSGVIRWFIRQGDKIVWADSAENVARIYDCDEADAKSFTFIASNIYDNKILLENDKNYLANLKAQNPVDRERLLNGNWNIKEAAGEVFRSHWFETVEAVPADMITERVRYWDRAGTAKTEHNNPDWTVGLLMTRLRNGIYIIENIKRFRGSPLKVEQAIINTAKLDGRDVHVGIEQDPGQAGKAEALVHVRNLGGFIVRLNRVTKDKVTRAKPLSAQAEAGNIKLLRGKWNLNFLNELENFPDGEKDDQVDSASGAFSYLTRKGSVKIIKLEGL